MAKPQRLLILASRRDRQAMDGVLCHLDIAVQQGLISLLWSDRTPAGTDLAAWTTEALRSADAVLLGLSAELLSDPSFLSNTLPSLVERQREGLRLLPLPLRPCLWRSIAELEPLRSLLPEEESLQSLPRARREQAELACAQALLPLLEVPSPHEPHIQILPIAPPRRTTGTPNPPAPRWRWFTALMVLFAALIGATLAFGPRLLSDQRALFFPTALLTIALAATLLLTSALCAAGRISVSNQGFLSFAMWLGLTLFLSLGLAVLTLNPPLPKEWLLRGRIEGLPLGREAWLSAPGCAEVAVYRKNERFILPVHGPCNLPELTLQVRVTGYEPQTFKLPRPAPSADTVLTWRSAAQRVSTVAATLTVDRRPLPRAPVRLMAECPEAATLAPVETGNDGRFLFANLHPACTALPFRVQITLPDGRLHPATLKSALSDVIELPPVASATPGNKHSPREAVAGFAVLVEDADHLLVKGLPPGHGFDRGHWLGLSRSGPGGDERLVGYGGVTEVTATTARVAVYYLRGAAAGINAKRLPPQPKVDKALGVVLDSLEEERVRINLGRADGVAPGDRYRVLGAVVSDHTLAGRSLGREQVGELEVEQVDNLFATAKVLKGSAERLSFIALER